LRPKGRTELPWSKEIADYAHEQGEDKDQSGQRLDEFDHAIHGKPSCSVKRIDNNTGHRKVDATPGIRLTLVSPGAADA
jgi:hypothetical protein